jgi:uncharacterized membrane protein YphA (DoxX/SURF4 family)
MSGWGGYDWGTIAFGSFFLVAGAMILLAPRRAPEPEPAWLSEARQRHGDGSISTTLAKPSFWRDRGHGLVMIFLGALQFLPRHSSPWPPILLTVVGGLFLIVSLFVLAGWLQSDPLFETWGQRRRRKKLERRIERGTDAYDGELRELLVHDRPAIRWAPGWGLAYTIVLTLFGGAFLALGLATPR